MSVVMSCRYQPSRDQDEDWRTLAARLHRLAGSLVAAGGRASAPDDLVQETLARTLTAGRSPAEFAYARTTLIRVYLDGERSARRRLVRTVRWARGRAGAHLSEDRADRDEAVRAARRALDGLSPMQRAAFTLRVIEGLSYASIATALETTESAVGSSVHAARRRLADALADWETP